MCLTQVIFSGYQFWFGYSQKVINVCSGYITCWHLGNVPDPKKVQFVRQITLGVNHSWPLLAHNSVRKPYPYWHKNQKKGTLCGTLFGQS